MADINEYSNGEITIVWEASKCIHSGKCARNLPGVFKPQERPWISVNNADTPHLKETIDKCPSGALTWKAVDAEKQVIQTDAAACDTELTVFSDGPIAVSGEFKMVDSEGKVLETKKKVFLCRCGASDNKPFCDGAHKKVEFKAK